jgi:hypothetical protein
MVYMQEILAADRTSYTHEHCFEAFLAWHDALLSATVKLIVFEIQSIF